MVVGNWGESRRMASVGWCQEREAGPLGLKAMAVEFMWLIFTGWVTQRHINENSQKFHLRSEAGKY